RASHVVGRTQCYGAPASRFVLNDSMIQSFNDSIHLWLCFLAASNSSPGCHAMRFGWDAAAQPSANPKRAITASPAKSMLGSYSSLGWWYCLFVYSSAFC